MFALVQRLVIWLTVGTLSLLAASAVLGIAAGHKPDSVMAGNSCELPCAFGVTPGLTDRVTAEQTYQRLAVKPASFLTALQYAFTLRLQTEHDAVSTNDSGLTLALVQFQQATGGNVRAVRLYEMSSSASSAQLWQLGELLLKGKHPDRVFASCDAADPKILLVFGDDTIAEVDTSGRLTPDVEISRLAVTADMDATLAPLLASFACTNETNWQGFASYWRYQAST